MSVERAQHPELDELAAFVDGRLARDRRQRMVEHLAACAACRELFAETASLVAEQDAGGRLLSGPWRRRIVLATAVAASVVLLLLSPWILERVATPPNSLTAITTDLVPVEAEPDRRLTAALSESWQSHEWPRPRSVVSTSVLSREEASFQLGIRIVELEIALRAGHDQLAQRLTYRLENLLTEDLLDEQVAYFYVSQQGIRGQLAAGVDPRTLTQLNATAAELLREQGAPQPDAPADQFWFELGLWARTAQLAAETNRHEFFAQRSNRRRLQDFAEQGLRSPAAASLDRLTELTENPAASMAEIERQLEILVTSAGGGQPTEVTD